MNSILQLNSSIFGEGGQSTRLAGELVSAMRSQNPGARVVVRDLVADPVPHLTAEHFGAFSAPERTPEQQAVVDYSDALIAEVQAADLIVLGLPMYNFGVPSQLKAWIDHIARAGVTFRYREGRPEGLLKGKRVIVIATRGGKYAGTSLDTQAQWLRDIFAFLGMTDVNFLYVEGLAQGDEERAGALSFAHTVIAELTRDVRAAA